MSAALDTNVLVRVLVQDPTAAAQCAAAKRVVADVGPGLHKSRLDTIDAVLCSPQS